MEWSIILTTYLNHLKICQHHLWLSLYLLSQKTFEFYRYLLSSNSKRASIIIAKCSIVFGTFHSRCACVTFVINDSVSQEILHTKGPSLIPNSFVLSTSFYQAICIRSLRNAVPFNLHICLILVLSWFALYCMVFVYYFT